MYLNPLFWPSESQAIHAPLHSFTPSSYELTWWEATLSSRLSLGRDDMEEMLLRAHWNIDQYAPWPTVSILSDLGYG
jgi:hypothetical protein